MAVRALLYANAYSGFMRSSQGVRDSVSFVPAGPVTADRYSRIMESLRAKGRPIPTKDVWIAAHAMETGADLASTDRHSGHIDQVVWVSAMSD